MIEQASDSQRAYTSYDRGDSGKIGALANLIGEIAFEDAIFGGGTGIDKNGTGFDHRTGN